MKFWFSIFVCLMLATTSAFASGAAPKKDGGHGGAKAKAPKKQRPITSLDSWVMVDPFSVTVVQEDRIRGKVLVSFGMDVPDAELRAHAELIMPRLQDAWLSAISLYAATSVRPGRPANVNDVSTILQSTADRVLGKRGSIVLIASVIVNMN